MELAKPAELVETVNMIGETRAFQFRASFAPCTIFQIFRHDPSALQQELTEAVSKAPDFFRGIPVIIDLERLQTAEPPDFALLKNMLLEGGLVPVGVRNGNLLQMAAAVQHGLPALPGGKSATSELPDHGGATVPGADKPAETAEMSTAEQSEKPGESQKRDVQPRTKVVTTPIRSGMQVYARDADLIVIASVSPGAELLADGHIHVYGPLRGRALAGVRGNEEARIFCSTLEAELISIAGYYLTKENMQAMSAGHGMIQVYLDGEQVVIGPVSRNYSG